MDNKISLGDVFSQGYGVLPKALMRDKDLNAYEKLILCYFLSYTGAGKNTCFPSLNTISMDLCISKNTVLKSIKGLEKKGYISKKQGNETQSNIYTLLFFSQGNSQGEQGVSHEANQSSSRGELKVAHELSSNINNINNNNYKGELTKKIFKKQALIVKEYIKLYPNFMYLEQNPDKLISYTDLLPYADKLTDTLIRQFFAKRKVKQKFFREDFIDYLANSQKGGGRPEKFTGFPDYNLPDNDTAGMKFFKKMQKKYGVESE